MIAWIKNLIKKIKQERAYRKRLKELKKILNNHKKIKNKLKIHKKMGGPLGSPWGPMCPKLTVYVSYYPFL